MLRPLLLLPVMVVALIPAPDPVRGCAPAPRHGEYVGVNAEEAVILYDTATETEHFIRRADFRTDAKDFGFLVPTPTKPDLGETKAEIFSALSTATAPRHVWSGKTQRIVQRRQDKNAPMAAGSAPPPRPPEVLDEKKGVAGYDLVVLRAEDIDGLKKWLEDRGYDARPALMDWLKWYVDNRWVITAFKISQNPDAEHDRWAKAVRMSFKTKAPFYPYREPADLRTAASPAARTLRVFYLGEARVDGTLGEGGAWPGKPVWANRCPDHTLKGVLDGIGLPAQEVAALGAKPWHLTEFEDQSSPRPGTHELFFNRAADQSAVERPPIYYDRYEYVYEDEVSAGGKPSSPDAEERSPLWLIVGVVGGLVLLTAVGLLVATKLAGRAR
jgi:hypothetical protein